MAKNLPDPAELPFAQVPGEPRLIRPQPFGVYVCGPIPSSRATQRCHLQHHFAHRIPESTVPASPPRAHTLDQMNPQVQDAQLRFQIHPWIRPHRCMAPSKELADDVEPVAGSSRPTGALLLAVAPQRPVLKTLSSRVEPQHVPTAPEYYPIIFGLASAYSVNIRATTP